MQNSGLFHMVRHEVKVYKFYCFCYSTNHNRKEALDSGGDICSVFFEHSTVFLDHQPLSSSSYPLLSCIEGFKVTEADVLYFVVCY